MPRAPGRRTDVTAVRSVAAAFAAIALLVAATAVVDLARVGYEHATTPLPAVEVADRVPLARYVSTQALAEAERAIPPGAVYTIAVGDDPPVPDHGAVALVFRTWLMPRRYTTRLSEAEWVIAYHRASESLGVDYTREVGLAPGANAVEVER